MSKKLQSIRGMKDVLPEENKVKQFVVDTARKVGEYYGFYEFSAPVLEFTDVFARTLGETSDVVNKEMYTFTDRGGNSVTLRPEFTAGIMRAFISGGMKQNLPLKFFSTGALFRYERPQKGRYRQFHQINFELLGVDKPIADIEVIALGKQIMQELGLWDRITLEINSLGDFESRNNYRKAVFDYFSQYKDELSEDSKMRLDKNPLRILDSKDKKDKEFVKYAPKMSDYYNESSKEFFARVLAGLDDLGIDYKINERLVRGLDYYCHSVFEFTTDELGSQSAVLAGGRYDGLAEVMGGEPTPAVGFAGGIERLCELVKYTAEEPRPIVIIPIGENAEKFGLNIITELRNKGLITDMAYSGNLKKRMQKADKINAKWAVIIGDEEIAKGVAVVKDLDKGSQQEKPFSELGNFFLKE